MTMASVGDEDPIEGFAAQAAAGWRGGWRADHGYGVRTSAAVVPECRAIRPYRAGAASGIPSRVRQVWGILGVAFSPS